MSRQLRTINEKTIMTDFCTYQFIEHMFCFTTLTRFSINFHANKFVFCIRNAKQFLFAMRHDLACDNKFVLRIKLKLTKIQKFSLLHEVVKYGYNIKYVIIYVIKVCYICYLVDLIKSFFYLSCIVKNA